MAQEGKPLAPKKRPGSRPKMDESARKLLESDMEKRPAATLPQRCEYVQKVAGLKVSDSTVSRMLKRMGWSRKKRSVGASERDEWLRAASLAGDGRQRGRHRCTTTGGVRRGDGHQHLASAPLRMVTPRRVGAAPEGAAQLLGRQPDSAGEHHPRRDGALLGSRRRYSTREVFEAYLEHLPGAVFAGRVR